MDTTVPVLVVLALAGGAYAARWIGKHLPTYSSRYTEKLRSKGHVRLARIFVLYFSILSYMISILVIEFGFTSVVLAVLLVFPTMEPVVRTYSGQMIDFVSILVTASSVLLGFAFAAEAVIAAGRSDIQDASMQSRFRSRVKWVKQVGLLCLLLSIAALLLNGLSQTYLAELALVTALLALVVEVLLVAAFAL